MATLFINREKILPNLDEADMDLSAVPCISHRYVLLNIRRVLQPKLNRQCQFHFGKPSLVTRQKITNYGYVVQTIRCSNFSIH